jgi:AraC-like DNA-binding protein
MIVKRELVQMTDARFPIKARIIRDCDESLGSASHIHGEIELLFLMEGAMEFIIENKSVSLQPGQILFIRGLVMHSSRVLCKEASTLCLLQFPIDLVSNRQTGEVPLFPNIIRDDTIDYYVFTERDAETAEITEILTDTVREFNEKNKAYDFVLKSYLFKLVSILYRKNILKMWESIEYIDDYSLRRLTLIAEYTERNYMKQIRSKDIAVALNIDYSYFCRLFKKMTGETFIQYLQYYRILAAKKMLLDKSKSISEIMAKCGFTSSSYFNRLFRAKTGYTPTEYRKKLITDKIADDL